MSLQVQVYGDDLDELYQKARTALEDSDAAECLERRTETTPDYSKEPFTALLAILVIGKTIDIVKDIIEERQRSKHETRYMVSIDGGDPTPITPEELISRLEQARKEAGG